ncbi:MAG TPA: M3 family oligoendopeptidase [Acidimicrobiia bacterium]|nr:M3 family oligoendopeptidase [Acidimicrobiia bacterium]
MTTTDTAPRWDLEPIFASVDDRAFTDALENVYAEIDRLRVRYDELDIHGGDTRQPTSVDVDALEALLDATNAVQEQLRRLNSFLYALTTTDSRDDRAAARLVELQTRGAPLAPLAKRLGSWLAALGGTEWLAEQSLTVAEHEFVLRTAAESAELQMSEAEESLAADLAPASALAWQRLHGDVSSQLVVELRMPGLDVERIPMTMARGLATHRDAARRRAAYDGELAAWATAAVPLAAALNGAKGTMGVLNRRRGFADDLEPALRYNNVDRDTLDAMTDAVVASLPTFRRYFRAKAGLLGHDGGLPWWDLFAPVGAETGASWSDATSRVRAAFGGFSPALVGLAERAFDERWVDAEMRDGKRGGAYCIGVEGDISRVMMNFDGSHDSVTTLAHELGHAFHNVTLADRTPLQRRLPMALAETASIFCETLLFEHAVALAGDDGERLALLDTHLVGAAQVVVDIHSRFLFETELCARRKRTSLSVDELNTAMLDAQDAAYGDGLHPDHRHPFMWAVKPHYYTPFYNWPYTFGLLFGIGLYARYLDDPEAFRAGYEDLLSQAGMADAVTLARGFGIDVRDGGFWTSSLDVLAGHVDDYVQRAESVTR